MNEGAIGQQGTGNSFSNEALIMNIVASYQPTENAHFIIHAGSSSLFSSFITHSKRYCKSKWK